MSSHAMLVDQSTQNLYRLGLQDLRRSGIPFLVGGAFALESYTGVVRRTKDLDVFALRQNVDELMRFLAEAGYETERRFPHWISKARRDDHVIDIIFGSGNGICVVDEKWFGAAPAATVLGEPVRLVPVEEMIWSKAFIMERDRYDGADIAHLLHARAGSLDWARLLWRFDRHWRVLFSHLVLFGFVYPGRRLHIPYWLMRELIHRLDMEMQTLSSDRDVCQGTLLSWGQYLDHIERGDYKDARHPPRGSLTVGDTTFVTERFQEEQEGSSGGPTHAAGSARRNGQPQLSEPAA